jgi:hypothetical protein
MYESFRVLDELLTLYSFKTSERRMIEQQYLLQKKPLR